MKNRQPSVEGDYSVWIFSGTVHYKDAGFNRAATIILFCCLFH